MRTHTALLFPIARANWLLQITLQSVSCSRSRPRSWTFLPGQARLQAGSGPRSPRHWVLSSCSPWSHLCPPPESPEGRAAPSPHHGWLPGTPVSTCSPTIHTALARGQQTATGHGAEGPPQATVLRDRHTLTIGLSLGNDPECPTILCSQ